MCPFASGIQTTNQDRRVEENIRTELGKHEEKEKKQIEITPKKDVLEQVDYFENLINRRTTQIYDGLNILATLLGLNKGAGTQEEILVRFKEKGIIDQDAEFSDWLNEPLRKGEAAVFVSRALNIKGGIMMRILPDSERYALRELVYENIMIDGNIRDILTGRELVYVFMQAADYIEKNNIGADRT
ncbi:MAG: hypothetical protein HQL29_02930 [Candidatus Omnitrophica bacterium]|nr:hypothetical protein [Candidatus Omnitrophota bacterium]